LSRTNAAVKGTSAHTFPDKKKKTKATDKSNRYFIGILHSPHKMPPIEFLMLINYT
jgi:hypothetical protein